MKLYESLDTPYGHIAVCFLLILVGIGMSALQVPKAEDIIVGSFGALLGALRGAAKG